MFDPKRVKVLKAVTLPVLSFKAAEAGVPLYLKFTGAIFVGKALKPAAGKEQAEKPADLAHVVNLATGELCQLVLPEVVKSNLRETYPQDSYVGKSFAIAKLGQRAGKRYVDYSVLEIEYTPDTAAVEAEDAKAAADVAATGAKKK